MSFSVEWSKAATKQLLSIPKKQRLIILSWVQEHLDGCEDPRRAPNGKQLQGTDSGWRWRVGVYRILARIEDGKAVIEVVRVGHRQGVYKNMPRLSSKERGSVTMQSHNLTASLRTWRFSARVEIRSPMNWT